MIDDITLLFCPKGLTIDDKSKLKVILTNSLPDFEWTTQYNQYLSNSNDETMKKALMLRIGLTLDTLFKLPEFQTI